MDKILTLILKPLEGITMEKGEGVTTEDAMAMCELGWIQAKCESENQWTQEYTWKNVDQEPPEHFQLVIASDKDKKHPHICRYDAKHRSLYDPETFSVYYAAKFWFPMPCYNDK